MKRLFFVVTLGVAGLMSANTISAAEKEVLQNEQISNSLTVEVVEKVLVVHNCTMVTSSCGEPGWLCKDNKTWGDIFEFYYALEEAFC